MTVRRRPGPHIGPERRSSGAAAVDPLEPRSRAASGRHRPGAVLVLIGMLISCAGSSDIGRDACPVTVPGDAPFTPASDTPEGPPVDYQRVWYGTSELWTMVGRGGEVWANLPVRPDGSLAQKTFWWVPGASLSQVPKPDVVVRLDALDDPAVTVVAEPGELGGNAGLGVFMVVGVEIPRSGCWQVTADHGDASVSYVAWIPESLE